MICPNCGRDIVPTKGFGCGWFILWLVVGFFTLFIPTLVYVIYYVSKTPRECPVCGYKNVYATK